MKTKILSLPMLGLLLLLASCESSIIKNPVQPLKKEVFSGYVQKGPFINGSGVTISELDASFNQTGRSYSTTVADNSGSFEQKNIELVSNYVQLKADGYYFNEVSGASSSGQLTLYAIADISQVNSANINVLTHLEKSRVEYLIKQKGLTFADAKKQAQTEVLKVFSLALPVNASSESMNLSAEGANNAMLLAVSCILQGTLSTADMVELMANIITDIKTDGTLDNASFGSQLIDNARLISLPLVRQHLVAKYAELGIGNVVIPDFESFVQEFKTKTTFTPAKTITYPVSGIHGLNLLNDTVKTFKSGAAYSMKADLPQGTTLKIVIKGKKYSWGYGIAPAPVNWTVGVYNDATSSQEFVVTESNKSNDIYLTLNSSTDAVTMEYYENGAIVPTKTKQITLEGSQPPVDVITCPVMGIFVNNYNVLNDSLTVTRAGKIYAMAAFIPNGKSLKVIIKGSVKSWISSPDSFTPLGWIVGTYNSTTISQEFVTTGAKSDMSITFPTNEKVTIEMYENNANLPTKVRYLNN